MSETNERHERLVRRRGLQMDAQSIEHVEWLAEERARLIMQNERLRSALKVIDTWASVDEALVPEHVKELCEKALRA